MTGGLYSVRVWHPACRATVPIDAWAESRTAALRSLRRFVRRENRRLADAGLHPRQRLPLPMAAALGVEVPRGSGTPAAPAV